ncbi:MAG: L-2-amino-thiazoline-4-carboxylic acid hydrolase [Candidatus Thorarchaeota archaeon]
MRSIGLKSLVKPIIRRAIWKAKKKAVSQILISRCRRDGLPEVGRFTRREIKRILLQTESNIEELMPYFKDFENYGNYMNEYGGLIDLAIYRALVKEGIETNYAMNLVSDMIWQARINAKGHVPIYDSLRLKLAKLRTKDPVAFLGKRLEDGLKFPYSEPGYRAELHKDNDVYCMDFYSCAVHDFYKQFGQEEMTLFRRSWCTFDYSVAELLVEGGKYRREHTLSDGDDVCDMRWFIDNEITVRRTVT